MSNHDAPHYIAWRKSRIDKLEEIFGKEFFKGKRVLECGAGNGGVGRYLRENWLADVTFTEGRSSLIKVIEDTNPGATVHLIDHENSWNVGSFDVVIHWGLLYHLNNWREELKCAFDAVADGGVLVLESEILNTTHIAEMKIFEFRTLDDQSLSGTGTRMSAAAVERELQHLCRGFRRYDDTNLNADIHHYDWKVDDSKQCHVSGQRRFWVFQK